ncbi:Rhomboid family protein [Malonomonas rubra DSM 5091]|uniref:Rhomboid family protein n=1 Tax=Malonomonas rubra DSM 5091 TaxID=1122189 RepID=A0A1M6M131_MALRU|nr:rhomboid family intramembrane serine protease [Malonomonas rubra]SHJ77191.1 Rhomboid family protein [Malonomonas rubra DSM 5091]
MFIPLSDTPNPPGRGYITWALIAANIFIYLLLTLPASMSRPDLHDPVLLEYLQMVGLYGKVSARQVYNSVSAYDLLILKYGFRPGVFDPLTLLTSLFLHGGFMHLAGNMLFLFIFGDNVEFRLGRFRYLLVYLLCGVASTLFFALFAGDSQVPLIGASGAISGVLGCYFLWYPRNRVRCFLFLFPFIMTSIYLSARLVLGFYLLIDNLVPFLFASSATSGVAYGAHIGGFLTGLAVAGIADQYYRLRLQLKGKPAKAEGSLASLQQICPAVGRGDLAGAADCYLGLLDRDERLQVDSADVLVVGNFMLEKGRFPEALHVFRRFISERQNDERIDQAYLGAGKAMLQQPRYQTSAYHYFLSALDLARSEQLAAEARMQLRLIEKHRTPEG